MADRYLMATTATHVMGDLTRDKPSLALIYGEDSDDWIGEWVTGIGYINVHFPKATTRQLTAEERAEYDGRTVQAGNGAFRIDIPREEP
jgi:hypothetical protein